MIEPHIADQCSRQHLFFLRYHSKPTTKKVESIYPWSMIEYYWYSLILNEIKQYSNLQSCLRKHLGHLGSHKAPQYQKESLWLYWALPVVFGRWPGFIHVLQHVLQVIDHRSQIVLDLRLTEGELLGFSPMMFQLPNLISISYGYILLCI